MEHIAFDQHYSDLFIGKMARKGNVIVYVAQDSEADEIWLMEAYYRGAEVVYSNDLDIPNLIDQRNLPIEWRK